jgi:Lon protease-like protein
VSGSEPDEFFELPQTVPLFPIAGAVLLPRSTLALNVFEPRYLNLVDDALGGDRLIGIIQPSAHEADSAALEDVGAVGRLTSFAETDDGRYLITLDGICRFRLMREMPPNGPYRRAEVDFEEFAEDLAPPYVSPERGPVRDAFVAYAKDVGFQIDADSLEHASVEDLISAAIMLCPFAPEAKQALLEAPGLEQRCTALIALLQTVERRPGGPLH